MYIKFGKVMIEDVEVIVSTTGFCNIKRVFIKYCSASKSLKTWGININGSYYKLSRILAHVFLDNTVTLKELRNERDKVVLFVNNNPLDVRIDNIMVTDQKGNINKNRSIEDDVYLIDLEGNIIDCGQKAELAAKYKVNKGTFHDTLKGNNRYCTLTTNSGKVKCFIVTCKDYKKSEIKDKLPQKNRSKKRINGETKVVQIDVNGDIDIITVKEAKDIIGDTGGLNMCLNEKRLTAGGYIWVLYESYIKDTDIVQKKLNQVKNHMFYGSKIKLKKF